MLRDDGSLVWMWDAYTTTDRFPYSQPLDRAAPTTSATRSRWSSTPTTATSPSTSSTTNDAIANTWGKVYEGLFTPGDQMPADLKRHWRYPEDIFTVQASVLATYHMTDPQIFYNKEDVWEIPKELYGQRRGPRRAVLRGADPAR